MNAQRSCTELEAGEEEFLRKEEERWGKTVEEIRSGFESLCLALQKFLLVLGHSLELIGEDNEVDVILANIGRATLPNKMELTELEGQSLKIIEGKWSEFVREARAGTMSLPSAMKEFMRIVGKYLICHAQPKSLTERSLVEKHYCSVREFFRSRGFRDVDVPPLNCTDEDLRKWFAEGKNVIYEPSDKEVSVALLTLQLPFKLLVEDPRQIVWEPVKKGRWLLVDAQERCPRVGERSYEGFAFVFEESQQILTLRQYAILWHFGSISGEVLDLETETLLSTPYGAEGILYAYSNLALCSLKFSVNKWLKLGDRHPLKGIRTVRVIE